MIQVLRVSGDGGKGLSGVRAPLGLEEGPTSRSAPATWLHPQQPQDPLQLLPHRAQHPVPVLAAVLVIAHLQHILGAQRLPRQSGSGFGSGALSDHCVGSQGVALWG